MTHEFSQPPKEFPGLVDCHPQANFNLFEMQIKPELRCGLEDGGEDVDMDYMMEMPFEYDNGNEAVCNILMYSLRNQFSLHRIAMIDFLSCFAFCLPVNLTTFIRFPYESRVW